jgi:hypothetical protein
LTEPVTITRNGRDRRVLLSAEEYDRLRRRDRRVVRLEDFSDEETALIAPAEVPSEYAHLDDELKVAAVSLPIPKSGLILHPSAGYRPRSSKSRLSKWGDLRTRDRRKSITIRWPNSETLRAQERVGTTSPNASISLENVSNSFCVT